MKQYLIALAEVMKEQPPSIAPIKDSKWAESLHKDDKLTGKGWAAVGASGAMGGGLGLGADEVNKRR